MASPMRIAGIQISAGQDVERNIQRAVEMAEVLRELIESHPNLTVLNGENVGEAQAQGFFFVDRPAGNYEVLTSTEVNRKVSFVLEKGQTRYIRFDVSMGFFVGHVFGVLVDEEKGREEVKSCKYTGKAATPAAEP